MDELNALEEFRANRDSLMQQYAELVTRLERVKKDHVTALKTLSARDAAYRARLKKATQRKLDKVTLFLLKVILPVFIMYPNVTEVVVRLSVPTEITR